MSYRPAAVLLASTLLLASTACTSSQSAATETTPSATPSASMTVALPASVVHNGTTSQCQDSSGDNTGPMDLENVSVTTSDDGQLEISWSASLLGPEDVGEYGWYLQAFSADGDVSRQVGILRTDAGPRGFVFDSQTAQNTYLPPASIDVHAGDASLSLTSAQFSLGQDFSWSAAVTYGGQDTDSCPD